MIGMAARHRRIKKIVNLKTIEEDKNLVVNSPLKKNLERKHSINNLNNFNYRKSILNEIEKNIKERNLKLLELPSYYNSTALIHCCKNTNTNHVNYFRKKSYAKLIMKLINININLLQEDNKGNNALMYLCNNITKIKYIKLVELYLEKSKKLGYNKLLIQHKNKQNQNISHYINTNISDNIIIKNNLQTLINFYK